MRPQPTTEPIPKMRSSEEAIASAREATVQGDWTLAERILLNALECENATAELHVHLGTLYAHQQRYRRAIHHWEQYALAEQPNDWLIHQIIDACMKCNEWNDAVRWADQIHTLPEGVSRRKLNRNAFLKRTRSQISHGCKSSSMVQSISRLWKAITQRVTYVLVSVLESVAPKWSEPNSGPSQFTLRDYMRFVLHDYPAGIDESLVYHKNREALVASRWLPIELDGARILDLGSGKSGIPRYWATRGCDVFTLDGSTYGQGEPNPTEAERAIQFSCGDATRLPFPDNTFDGGAAICLLEHIPHGGDIESMRELFRVLQPGGIAVVTVESSSYSRELWLEVPYEIGYQGGTTEQPRSEYEEVFCRQYTPSDIVDRLIGSASWDIITDGYYDDTWFPWRRWLDAARPMLITPLLQPFQPILSVLFYRPAVPYKPLSPSSIGYLVLRKPYDADTRP